MKKLITALALCLVGCSNSDSFYDCTSFDVKDDGTMICTKTGAVYRPTPTHNRSSSPSKAEQALINYGFTNIQMGGSPIFFSPCSDSDSTIRSSRFTATNANGMRVEGVVCCGFMLKGCTVRF